MTTQAIHKLPWPENLLRRLFKDGDYDEWKNQIPPDFDASFKFILEETLTEREIYILYSFFRDHIPMRFIGQRYGIQGERCRQISERAIRKIRHPSRLKYIKYGLAEVERRQKETSKEIPIIQQPIEDLEFSVKAYNCLKRANVRSIEELTALSRFDLLKIRNMGIKTIAEVETKLKDKGLSLRSDYE